MLPHVFAQNEIINEINEQINFAPPSTLKLLQCWDNFFNFSASFCCLLSPYTAYFLFRFCCCCLLVFSLFYINFYINFWLGLKNKKTLKSDFSSNSEKSFLNIIIRSGSIIVLPLQPAPCEAFQQLLSELPNLI